ncbi:MAG: hypothetical protein JO308_14630 [Verrucomicrobia bacterium]|nr:hypothetical protein [Verrucomicrobiota bacterium]
MSKLIAALILLWSLQCESSLAYNKLGNNAYQSNGTQADTLGAINACGAGGTVVIPKGTYTWSAGITVSKTVRLNGQAKAGVTIVNNVVGQPLITVATSVQLETEISNLNLVQGSGNGDHLMVYAPILLHDCYFETNGTVRRSIHWATNGGVIWNCRFYSNRSDDSGIGFKPTELNSSWKTNSTMGTADVKGTANTYVEDCTFKDLFLQAMDFDDNSRTVVRHCTFDNSAITSHGQDTSPAGARHWEVYNNVFTFTPSGGGYPLNLNYFFYVRGGTGIIANNVIPHIGSQAWGQKSDVSLTVFNIRRSSQFVSCQTKYPAARQIGQSWQNGAAVTDPIYIWGNTGTGNHDHPGIIDYEPDQCGNGQHSADYIKAGRDYVTGSAKPGYTEYPYPHPLRR